MKKNLPIFILFGCGAVFACGLALLFELRFAHGDVYPAYSSLRADPLGTMAFYEGLSKIPGLAIRRDFNDANRLPAEPHTAYLHLAGPAYEFDQVPADLFQEIKNFLARGNRLVITFFPQMEPDNFYNRDDDRTNSAKMTPPAWRKEKNPTSDEDNEISLADKWNFHVDFQKLSRGEEAYLPAVVFNQTSLPLPRTLNWHSAMVFTNCDSAWRAIYARGGSAVIMERSFGQGSVVLVTDSFFVSNEAMAKDRHADLLAWLVGENKNVVFDEAHFGIVETSGVTTLMRKYRLHGFAAGLILLAGLFIWKNSTSLVPPPAKAETGNFIAGRDSAAGFVNLLRRGIVPRDLLATCYVEWKKSAGKNGPARFQQAEAIFQSENSLPNKDKNPVATYRKISETLVNQNQKL
jgi:hypothetical protein